MKITVNTKQFLKDLRLVSSIIDKHSNPTIQDVKLVVSTMDAFLYATNAKQSIRLPLWCEVFEAGKVVLPLQDVLKILKITKEKSFHVYSGGKVHIDGVSGNESYTLDMSNKTDDFPDVLPFKHKEYIQFIARDLRIDLGRTLFAADNEKDAFRSACTGVNFEFPKRNAVDIVATNGNRLAWQQSKVTFVGTKPKQTVVPAKALKLLEKVLVDVPDTVAVRMAIVEGKTRSVWFSVAGTTIISTLPAEIQRYPDWRGLFKIEVISPSIEISQEEVQRAIEILSPVAKAHKGGSLELYFYKTLVATTKALVGDNTMSITIKAENIGKYKDNLQVDLGLFIDALKAIRGTSDVTMTVQCKTFERFGGGTQRGLSIVFETADKYKHILIAKEIS